MNDLVFDESKHQYTYKGIAVPSVTQVLKSAGIVDFSMVPAAKLEASCLFGTAVHKATELWEQDKLDEDALDSNLKPYLSGWQFFCQEYGFIAEYIEEMMFSKIYKVAGKPDRIGSWRIDDSVIIPDIKTSAGVYSVNGVQLAGYELIYRDNFKTKKKVKRITVLLNAEGKYKVTEHKDKTDKDIFICALSLFNWKEKHGK
jgi:hypothetical protein